jgi:hypothetical protein
MANPETDNMAIIDDIDPDFGQRVIAIMQALGRLEKSGLPDAACLQMMFDAAAVIARAQEGKSTVIDLSSGYRQEED